MIKGSYYMSKAGYEYDEVWSLILRRRLQILIHSCLYYHMNTNIITDGQWDQWAKELVQLQKDFPKIASKVDFHRDFRDFDGATGFHLPYKNEDIIRKTRWLLEYGRNKTKRNRIFIPGNKSN